MGIFYCKRLNGFAHTFLIQAFLEMLESLVFKEKKVIEGLLERLVILV